MTACVCAQSECPVQRPAFLTRMASVLPPAFVPLAPATLSASLFSGSAIPLAPRHSVKPCSARPYRRRPRAVLDTGDSPRVAESEELATAAAAAAKSAAGKAGEAVDAVAQAALAEGRGGDVFFEGDVEGEDGEGVGEGMVKLGPIFGKTLTVPGRYLLYSVPFMWGTFGPAVRLLFMSDPHPGPSVFNTERLLLSNAVYFPILSAEVANIREKLRVKKASANVAEEIAADEADPFLSIRAGVELGAYVFCANVAQVIGLQSTSASRAAFLVQLQTVFIPVIAAALGIAKVSRNTWIGSITALAGVALLSSDKGHGAMSSLTGDSLEVLSAFFFSLFVIRLGAFCNRIPPGPLVASKLAVQAFLSICWAVSVEAFELSGPGGGYDAVYHENHPWTLPVVAVNLGVVAWTGLICSALSGWFQTKGQQSVDADETAVIFATQPLWAAATAAILLGEGFGPKGFAGGALIVGATIFSSLREGNEGIIGEEATADRTDSD